MKSNHQERILRLADDPLRFVALCWPGMQIYDKQRDLILSVRDNVETFVHAANQTGKTRSAALCALWFFATRTPARVVLSSSSETQLSSILWSEIRVLLRSSRLHFPFELHHLRAYKLRDPDTTEREPADYILGYVTNTVENFQGHHLDHDRPRVLVIFDEASGVPDEFYEASDSWAHRKLVIGNPLSNSNFFYRACKRGDEPDPAGRAKLLRKVIHIDGRDSPNVKLGMRWEAENRPGRPPALVPGILSHEVYKRREQQWDVVKRTTRLYGQFYEGEQSMLFPATWLNAAMDRWRWAQLQGQPRRALALGVDVASGGRDKTCWTLVDREGVIEQIVEDTPQTMHIVGRTIDLIKRYELSAKRVALDAGGGGKQIADRLHEQRYRVQLVGFGERPEAKQTYRNRRAELYGELRHRLDPSREVAPFALPPDADELRRELAVLPLQYDSEGRLLLPPKERRSGQPGAEPSLRELLGRSPDRADSLALAAWALGQRAPSLFVEGPLLCSPGPDDGPLTREQIENAHPLIRWLIERPIDYDDDSW